MQPIWDELLLTSHSNTVFQSWAYLFNNWYYRKQGNHLHRNLILLTLHNDVGLVAIAPMWLTTARNAAKIIGFIGDHYLDYLDFIVHSSVDRSTALEYMIASLVQSGHWHMLVFSELRSHTASEVCAVLDSLSLSYSCRPCSETVSLPLPATYDDYLSSLGRNTRRNLLKYPKKLKALHNVSFEVHSEFTPGFRNMLGEIHAIHQERWAAVSEAGAFRGSNIQQMDCAVQEALSRSKMLRYFVLSVDSRPIAAVSGAVLGDHLYTHIMSVSRDEEFQNAAPAWSCFPMSQSGRLANGYGLWTWVEARKRTRYVSAPKAVRITASLSHAAD